MKRIFAAVLIVMAVACWSDLSAEADWIRYSSPQGRYSILFPAQPGLSTSNDTPPQMIASSSDSNGIQYLASYLDMPPGKTFDFTKGREGLVNKMGGMLVYDNPITLGNIKGRSFKYFTPGPDGKGYNVNARYYRKGSRVYLLQMISAYNVSASAVSAAGRKYFDSFRIVK